FDSIIEVESAKVNTEIPSPATGTLLKILVEEGTTVNAGTILAWIGEPGEKLPDDSGDIAIEETQPVSQSESSTQPIETEPVTGRDRDLGFISPVVAKLAQEHQIDLHQIKGTGNNGRITKKDVLDFIKYAPGEDVEAPAWETPGEGDL